MKWPDVCTCRVINKIYVGTLIVTWFVKNNIPIGILLYLLSFYVNEYCIDITILSKSTVQHANFS